jgi:inner membrane protein involved in colicin E2 resistance
MTMIRRILALILIFICATIAWLILGATIFYRTDDVDKRLQEQVASTWGSPQEQTPPTAAYTVQTAKKVETTLPDGKVAEHTETVPTEVSLPLNGTDADVSLNLEYRQKGLLWYSLYKVNFGGTFTFHNTSPQDEQVLFRLKFPAQQAIYDNFVMSVNDTPASVTNQEGVATATALVPAGSDVRLRVSYSSQGLESWYYSFGGSVEQVRKFRLHMTTDFKEIDFPENTLSPTAKQATDKGWDLTWAYNNLVSGFRIGMPMPQKLQPGPLAGQISLFAPVSLFFFFFIMFIITTMREIDLHPMNYFFLAGAFFAFHLLLAYLADQIPLQLAFIVCSLVSMFLVISYLRLVTGIRFAAVEAGLAQFVYLILFSYAFFFKGLTGLTITIGAIVTLFVVMQMTGRIRWSEKFAEQKQARTP